MKESGPHRPPLAPPPTPAISARVQRAEGRGWRAGFWILAYVILTAFPLFVLLLGDVPRGGGFAWDFAMAVGFGGLAIMGLQSVLTARFRRATAPFGVDIIYYFHRLAALGGFVLIVAHAVILQVKFGAAVGPMGMREAPWHMTAGRLALLLFAALIVSSLWRKTLRIEYDRWRVGHAVMAVAAIVLAIVHIQGIGHYTRTPWKGIVWGGYTAVWLLVVGYVRIGRPMTLLRSPYRVVDIRRERGRSWTLTMEPSGHPGFTFCPGQFAWLSLRASPFRAKEHPFSFSGSAAETGSFRFTIKELGDFTRSIKDVKPGEVAYVDGPHGIFTTDHHPNAAGFVFIAGGVGIAPIMSMLRTLADRGDPRPMRLVYGNRIWDEILFREEIERLHTRLRLAIVHVLQEPPRDWTGLIGMLTPANLREAIAADSQGTVYFVCGPKPMTDSVQRTLRATGVTLRRIHCELFDMA